MDEKGHPEHHVYQQSYRCIIPTDVTWVWKMVRAAIQTERFPADPRSHTLTASYDIPSGGCPSTT